MLICVYNFTCTSKYVHAWTIYALNTISWLSIFNQYNIDWLSTCSCCLNCICGFIQSYVVCCPLCVCMEDAWLSGCIDFDGWPSVWLSLTSLNCEWLTLDDVRTTSQLTRMSEKGSCLSHPISHHKLYFAYCKLYWYCLGGHGKSPPGPEGVLFLWSSTYCFQTCG